MNFGIRMVQTHRVDKRVITRRMALLLQYRMRILAALWGDDHGDSFIVQERCSKCDARLTLIQILAGFSQSPTDTLSTCPKCQQRFQPILVGDASQTSPTKIAFLCSEQTLAQLQGKENKPFHTLINIAYGRSALIHFGGLKQAFAKIGRDYKHEARAGWQERIRPFLGRVPDRVIAEVVGTSRATVGRMRREMEISRYTRLQQ